MCVPAISRTVFLIHNMLPVVWVLIQNGPFRGEQARSECQRRENAIRALTPLARILSPWHLHDAPFAFV